MRLSLSLTDVRLAGDLADYTGELSAQFVVRRTDKESQPFNSTPGTMLDRTFSFDAACTPTAGPEGASCTAQTTADALVPEHRPRGPACDLGAWPGPCLRRRCRTATPPRTTTRCSR